MFMEWLAYNGTISILDSNLRMNTVPGIGDWGRQVMFNYDSMVKMKAFLVVF